MRFPFELLVDIQNLCTQLGTGTNVIKRPLQIDLICGLANNGDSQIAFSFTLSGPGPSVELSLVHSSSPQPRASGSRTVGAESPMQGLEEATARVNTLYYTIAETGINAAAEVNRGKHQSPIHDHTCQSQQAVWSSQESEGARQVMQVV